MRGRGAAFGQERQLARARERAEQPDDADREDEDRDEQLDQREAVLGV
jgi:hypothetical protein